ncbi:hypothetical protein KL86SPO_70590 [uncultured Sporomusa sp.]|uniref:Uncharacterized protein n=1 Tax=uncultured Sporomusa sp. TaxID=307249 RepID=A0A212M1P3_9FIRM|nr:hypothetical protein [uncultured Sporomusa sp.]SCM83732.1 hypothetical protein KL86SPO_70590 [uncultured Sporomusa sp.]
MKILVEQLKTIQVYNPLMFAEIKKLITSANAMIGEANNGIDLHVVKAESEKINKATAEILSICECYSSMVNCEHCGLSEKCEG